MQSTYSDHVMYRDMHTTLLMHAPVMQKAAECLHSNTRSKEPPKKPREDSYSVVWR